MAPRDIVIVGTGGSGRETYALLRDIEREHPGTWNFKGFLGIDPPDVAVLERVGAHFLGDPRDLVSRIPEAAGWHYALGIGAPQHRRAMDTALVNQGLGPASLIHPTALTGPDVEIGEGAVVCAHTVMTTNVRVGRSVQVNIGCVIAHDARIGDYVTFAQSVNIAGDVTIRDNATVFTGAMALPGTTIGADSVVGAGAVVRTDVPDGATVVGMPARPL
jgi:sugar O-acyltransferase (sialic acid O-acetyltransferase NeuD family)